MSTESVTSVVQTPMTIFKELLPKVFHEPLQIPKVLPLASKKVVPPKTLPKPGQKLVQSNSLLKPIPPPKPDTRSTAFEHDAIQVVSKNTEKTIIKRRVRINLFDIYVVIFYQRHCLYYRFVYLMSNENRPRACPLLPYLSCTDKL